MKKEKILITGGSGFVGTNLIDKLPKDFFEIFSLDIEKQKINFDIVNYENMDIRSKHVGELIKDIDPKIILHLAAQSSVSVSSKNPVLDNDVNLSGSLNLFLNFAAIAAQRIASDISPLLNFTASSKNSCI